MTKRKKGFLWLVSIVIALLIGVVGFFFWVFYKDVYEDYSQRMMFDTRIWTNREAVEKSPYPRLRMVDDLLKKQNFIGNTRQEVIAVLGEPEKTGYFKSYDLVYWLGPERGFISIDSEWLIMKLNSNKRVSECRIASD